MFLRAVSSLLAAFITSEVVLNDLEDNENVLLVTLDAEKAFDKLNHEISSIFIFLQYRGQDSRFQ
jgi:hypothetical protein